MLKCTNILVKSLSQCRIQCVSVIFNTAPNLQSSARWWSSKTITNYQAHLFCCIVCFVIMGWWWLRSDRVALGVCQVSVCLGSGDIGCPVNQGGNGKATRVSLGGRAGRGFCLCCFGWTTLIMELVPTRPWVRVALQGQQLWWLCWPGPRSEDLNCFLNCYC